MVVILFIFLTSKSTLLSAILSRNENGNFLTGFRLVEATSPFIKMLDCEGYLSAFTKYFIAEFTITFINKY
jgi:hypothetical protein